MEGILDFCGGGIYECVQWLNNLPMVERVLIVGGIFIGLFLFFRLIYWIILMFE